MIKGVDFSKMYEFIGYGNTIYDYIAQYLPELNGDFSRENILKNYDSINERMQSEGFAALYGVKGIESKQMLLNALMIRVSKKVRMQAESGEISPEMAEKFSVISNLISHENRFNEYEKYLEKTQPMLQAQYEKMRRDIIGGVKREKASVQRISELLSFEQKGDVDAEGLEALFKTDKPSKKWSPENSEASFVAYAEPKLVLSGQCDYSNIGEDKQVIIAMSHGRFYFDNNGTTNYNKRNPLNDALYTQPELIGITRITPNGFSTDFVIMPLCHKDMAKTVDPSKGEKEVLLSITDYRGRRPVVSRANLVDVDGNPMKYVSSDYIYGKTSRPYLDIMFSELYLNLVKEKNHHYAGYITPDPSDILYGANGSPRFVVNTHDMGQFDFEGSRFVEENPFTLEYATPKVITDANGVKHRVGTEIGGISTTREVGSLQELIEDELFAKQIQAVNIHARKNMEATKARRKGNSPKTFDD